MRCLYNIGIYLFEFICFLAKPFNKKIRLMCKGQKDAFYQIQKLDKNKQTVWFHCASLGEFEQARNLIEEFKKRYNQFQILITFFSPSGYEVRKNYALADCVTYLPFDTTKKAKRFVSQVNPSMVFIIKYEFWFNYIRAVKHTNLYSVSLILNKQHYLFKPYCSWFLKQLKCFSHFFVQDELSAKLLQDNGFENVTISGDTRFDRVIKMSKEKKDFPLIEKFKGNKKIFLAGSSWPPDEKLVQRMYKKLGNKDLKLIIAPHLVDTNHINSLLNQFDNSVKLSNLTDNEADKYDVLIIDCIGILMYLYALSDMAYIGGGFGVGIHNILEAAVFYKPVAFGPKNKKFIEAVDMLNQKAAKQIENADDLFMWTKKLITDKDYYKKISSLCGQYVHSNSGATQRIIETIKDNQCLK